MHLKAKVAFTLAEVLIILGIIGVVAAITLPTLLNKIQDRQNIAKWEKEYSVISNAFQLIVNDSVQIRGDNGRFTKEFLNSMKEKLNIVDMCSNQALVPRDTVCDMDFDSNNNIRPNIKYSWSGISGHSTRSFFKALGGSVFINNYNFNQYAYLLNDGAAVYFGGSHGGPWIVVDVNNFNKGPNEFGRDVFVIKVIPEKFVMLPMGADGTFDKTINGDICECSKDKGVKTATYIVTVVGENAGKAISGACCSAYYLYNK